MPAADRDFTSRGTLRRVRAGALASRPGKDVWAHIELPDADSPGHEERVAAHARRVAAEAPWALGTVHHTDRQREVSRQRQRRAAELLALLGPLNPSHLAGEVGCSATSLQTVMRSEWFARRGRRWHLTAAGRAALEEK